ncbi:MAG TPA: radical SAM protein [Verrucomicrobiae bacterium]|nr:radical SAM protein [Verrucomicrobiae bacterium]
MQTCKPDPVRSLSEETKRWVERAWEVRCGNFPMEIEFDYPEGTEVVTLTGKSCALDCAHCGGHYLEGMKTVEEVQGCGCPGHGHGSKKDGAKSCLISGGCDSHGKVPFMQQLPFIEEMKRDKKLNFHVGLVNQAEIDTLENLADVVSFDFVADNATISEVFGLGRTAEDYLNTYRALRKKVKVLPHICIGLKGGEIAGEYKAMDLLEEEGVDGLVFIVFIPTAGTRYAEKSPPPLEEVVNILAEARVRFPDKPIFLGCMRPKGRYRQDLDLAAVKCGVNKIVVPTRAAVELARDLGLEVLTGEECCVL